MPCDDGRIVARRAADRGRPVAEPRRPVDCEGERYARHGIAIAVVDPQAHGAGACDVVVLQFHRHRLRHEQRRFGEQLVHALEQLRVLLQCLTGRGPSRRAGCGIEGVMHDDCERRLRVVAVVHMLVFVQQCGEPPVLRRIGQRGDRADPHRRRHGLLDAVVPRACGIVADRPHPIRAAVVRIHEVILGFGRGQYLARRRHRRTQWRGHSQCHRHACRQCGA